MRKRYVLVHKEARQRAVQGVMLAPEGSEVTIGPERRTSAQNRLLWSRLDDLAKKGRWAGRKLTAEQWKDLLTATLFAYDVVPNLNNTGFVALGKSTKDMRKQEIADMLTLCDAVASDQEIDWTLDPEAMHG